MVRRISPGCCGSSATSVVLSRGGSERCDSLRSEAGERSTTPYESRYHSPKITLEHVTPVVLRRIEVPLALRLHRLHLAMQAAIGWTTDHCYEIRARDAAWGIPNDVLATAIRLGMPSNATCAMPSCEGIAVPPGSKSTSRAKGSRRKLGYLVTGRQCRVRGMVRIGKVRSRSR